MLSDLLQPIGQALFEIVFYFIGRLVVTAVSFGHWRCEALYSNVPKREMRWCGLFHYRSGRVYFTSEGTELAGAIFCLFAVGGVVWIWYLSR
jgi:hypothetical protein